MGHAQTDGRAEDRRWHVKKHGTRFFADGVLTALTNEDGGPARGFAKVLRDATEQKRAEDALNLAYRRERRIAEALQRSLLPILPADKFSGLEVAPFYEAALAEAQVGGDFYDAFALGDTGRVAFVVGDVSGKGLSAAAHTAEIKNVLRAFLRETGDPGATLERLNAHVSHSQHLGEWSDSTFVAVCVVVVDPAAQTLQAAFGGAEPPLVLRQAAGKIGEGYTVFVTTLPSFSMPLGVEPDETYATQTLLFGPGDVLLLVTDGITEARVGGNLFGYERMTEVACDAFTRSAALPDIGATLLSATRDFAGGTLHDDVCLLLVRHRAV